MRSVIDGLRSGEWLNRARVRSYLLILAAANLLSLAWLLVSARNGFDLEGRLLGTDFVSFWAAGQMIQFGGNPYNIAAHAAAQGTVWIGQTGYTAFFYPPVFLLWCWPLGLFGYFPALASWLVLTGAALIGAVRVWMGRINWLAVAAFPPLVITITHGQTSFLLAALLGLGVWCAAKKQHFAAGVLLGLATFKPQFGVLVPLVLLAGREWRVIGWAGLTAVVLAGVSTLIFGTQVWFDWLSITRLAQDAMADGAIGFAKMQSLFAMVRLWGGGARLAFGMQTVLAAGTAATLVVLAWRRGLTLEVGAATLVGALLATPFLLDYDFVLLAFPLILLHARDPLPWERTAAAIAFAMPAFARPLAIATGVPLAVFVTTALFILLARRAALAEPATEV
ncbi:hypothetical protein GGQ88_000303 [Novosphingobium hassiacum]|uniref:DUF2029 domain-containing protein n=1 Tax=Novosphingobium hassiacum TaxID=173676 RepID=A0A7W5ZTZ4_9SPHN|nr:hypothetical protein [Novosphingobium hassiacum]